MWRTKLKGEHALKVSTQRDILSFLCPLIIGLVGLVENHRGGSKEWALASG